MSSSRTPRLPPPCPHLAASRHGGAAGPLRALRRCLRPRPPGRAEVRRDPGELPRCASCSPAALAGSRLYACLACATISCRAHAPGHASAGPGHEIALDVDRAELFCCACRDQVYHPDLDAAVVLALASASTSPSPSQSPPPEIPRKRRRMVEYRPWAPDSRQLALVGNGSSPLLVQDGIFRSSTAASAGEHCSSSLPRGLRGLNNLGNTCFMNAVLQALLHTPLLRNYFLSDRHNRDACCRRRSKSKIGGGTVDNGRNVGKNATGGSPVCLACDLDAMYSAAFSGDRKPYSPARFLYSWWQHASNLASYEQQDAHDFFISMLDGIHEKEQDQQKPHSHGNGDCCIAHRVFSGILRSDVTCTICGFTSTTYDPCVDFSLDLNSSPDSMKIAMSKSISCNGETELLLSSQTAGISTLIGCLDRFTRPEKLGSDQKFFCQHCKVRQESLKQMSIRKLPLVTCFQIKRFEHSSIKKLSKKVDRYLQFPFSLNLAPYLASSILRSRCGNRIFAFDGDDSNASTDIPSEFELFAVITHCGKLESGHYTTYIRLSNQWYKCDDAWITRVTESTVRATQAYMLFYVQKILYYKAGENAVTS